MVKKPESIAKILKRHKNEWLLIAPERIDEKTLKPKTGRLIAHSPRKKDLEEILTTYKGDLYSLFAGPPLPPGLRAVFGYSLVGQSTQK